MDNTRGKLRTEAAARYVGLAPATLAKMRVRGDGPPFSKAGARVVVYDIQDLEDWLRSTRRATPAAANCAKCDIDHPIARVLPGATAPEGGADDGRCR